MIMFRSLEGQRALVVVGPGFTQRRGRIVLSTAQRGTLHSCRAH